MQEEVAQPEISQEDFNRMYQPHQEDELPASKSVSNEKSLDKLEEIESASLEELKDPGHMDEEALEEFEHRLKQEMEFVAIKQSRKKK